MRRFVNCMACLAAMLALSVPAWAQVPPAAKWSQPVDETTPWSSLSTKAPPPHVPTDWVSADDWRCTDGLPVTRVRWWGEYHSYKMDEPGPVDASDITNPARFILSWYRDVPADPNDPGSYSKPGEQLATEDIVLAKVNQTYVKTVQIQLGGEPTPRYIHIFQYEAELLAPWEQEKDAIYWIAIQADFDSEPERDWEWLTTAADGTPLIDNAVYSQDQGTTWTKADYAPTHPEAGKQLNLAFELSPLEAVVTPDTIQAGTPTQVNIVVNVPPIGQAWRAYVVVELPNGQMMSFVQQSQTARGAKGVDGLVLRCVPVNGIQPLGSGSENVLRGGRNVTIFDSVVSLSEGTYELKVGFFDAAQPILSENDAFLLTTTDVVVTQ